MSQSSPPPGWYEDTRTSGTCRWWDGTQWTDHVQALVPVVDDYSQQHHQALDNSGGHDGYGTYDDKPKRRNRSIIAGSVVIGIIGLAAIGSAAGNDADEPITAAAQFVDDSPTSTDAADQTTTSTIAPAATDQTSTSALVATSSSTDVSTSTAAPTTSAAAALASPSSTTTSTAPATTNQTTAATIAPTTAATEPATTSTTQSSGCDPNYSGCVPIASDVDCAGGSGNGPAYVQGPVNVIGNDIYGLDSDNDGVGCETD